MNPLQRDSQNQNNLLIEIDHKELLSLIDKRVTVQTAHLQNQIAELQEKVNGLNQLVTNFKKGQRSRKKSQLTKEERDLCLFVYSLCLKGVKERLSDLPLVRGNLEASNRVDNLVDELYAKHNEVKKAVDSNPPVLTKNDIRLHILNVMVEQRRRKRRGKNPTTSKKRKRETGDEEINNTNNNDNNNNNRLYDNHSIPLEIKKYKCSSSILDKDNKNDSNNNNNNDDDNNDNERERIFDHAPLSNHDETINNDHDQIKLKEGENDSGLEYQSHEFNENSFSAEYYYQNFDNFDNSSNSSSANDILFSLMVEEDNEQQTLNSGSNFDHVNEPPKKKFKAV